MRRGEGRQIMWVQLSKFPKYFADSSGHIISTHNNTWKVLKPGLDKDGYPLVTLCESGKRYTRKVYRLIAEVFLGPSTLEVNHKNGIKTDCELSNLEYATRSQNQKHAHNTGLVVMERGEKCRTAKHSDEIVQKVIALKGTMSQKKAGELFGISQSYVGILWNTGGRSKHRR